MKNLIYRKKVNRRFKKEAKLCFKKWKQHLIQTTFNPSIATTWNGKPRTCDLKTFAKRNDTNATYSVTHLFEFRNKKFRKYIERVAPSVYYEVFDIK